MDGLGKEVISPSQRALFTFVLERSGGYSCTQLATVAPASFPMTARQTAFIFQVHPKTPKGCWIGRVRAPVTIEASKGGEGCCVGSLAAPGPESS